MALASQSIRSQTMPRSMGASSRSHRRTRHRRLIGILLLAGVCIGITYWAMRQRDGTAAAGGPDNAADSTSPETRNLVAASPLGDAGTRRDNKPASPPPSLTMGEVHEPLANMTTTPPASTPRSTLQPAATPSAGASEPRLPPTAPPTPTTPPTASTAADPAPSSPSPALTGTGLLAEATGAADRATAQGRPLEARTVLNRALLDPRSTATERVNLRRRLSEINDSLMFGPAQTPGDPFTETYRVVGGDNLHKIADKLHLITEPSLIARVNKLANPNALRVGQTLKIVRGPFHAVVDKSEYRMDIYAGPAPTPSSIGTGNTPDNAEPGWTYVCSFPVGLGAQGLTPLGNFTLKSNSKLVNPHWVNPRTGEKFDADNPQNPIGERWMGLEGLDDKSKAFTGYGIHGTIDPASIGHEMSMGCVRMNAADVERVYELLTPRVSVVKIVP